LYLWNRKKKSGGRVAKGEERGEEKLFSLSKRGKKRSILFSAG